jgi:acyl carrier protein
MNYQIRQIIAAHGRMPVDPHALEDHADLYQAGMTSHASVNAMLALEDAFNIECPDAMLTRGVFESIAAALTELDAMTSEQGGLGPVAKFRAAVGGRRDVPRPSSQRAQELTFEVSIGRLAQADRRRLVQLPPGPLRADLRDRAGRRTVAHKVTG